MAPFLISVVITNYNYAEYVASAIDSALALDWPRLEVIVVDDGSTDASREVIERYEQRVVAYRQPNEGQLVAGNRGFALSHGDIVIFLDSDDVLHPSLAREVVRVWSPAVSKVQVQMRVIDACGEPTGQLFPHYDGTPSAQDIRQWWKQTTAYPTPPGSGNAYSRAFLERIFPLPLGHREAPDSYCLAAAPLFGDVITVAKPLVSYRVHGRNDGAMSTLDVDQFARQVVRARRRHSYACSLAPSLGEHLEEQAIDRSLEYLRSRVASLKLKPQKHPLAADRPLRVLCDFVAAALVPQGVSTVGRWLTVAWAFAVCLSPVPVARKFVLWRFVPSARPQLLVDLLALAGVGHRNTRRTANST